MMVADPQRDMSSEFNVDAVGCIRATTRRRGRCGRSSIVGDG